MERLYLVLWADKLSIVKNISDLKIEPCIEGLETLEEY